MNFRGKGCLTEKSITSETIRHELQAGVKAEPNYLKNA